MSDSDRLSGKSAELPELLLLVLLVLPPQDLALVSPPIAPLLDNEDVVVADGATTGSRSWPLSPLAPPPAEEEEEGRKFFLAGRGR